MKISILVATHKSYRMPEDPMYLPLHVGAAGKKDPAGNPLDLGYTKDDTGDNISEKNAHYCELTGLYWAWKNLEADVLGLAHYRRHFTVPGSRGDKWKRILTKKQLLGRLKNCDVVLPRPRNYVIESGYSQYVHAHHEEDLVQTRKILVERFPEMVPVFDRVMKRTTGHRFNMFIMRRDLADAYCEWLFEVLGELEQRLDISGYSDYDSRVFGFVGERLLDVWIEGNEIPYIEMPVMYMEHQNWLIKGGNFLKRKFLGGVKSASLS